LKILFAGTPEFAASHLSGLLDQGVNIIGVITQPDKPGKRGKKPLFSDVKKLALHQKIPLIQPEKLRLNDLEPFDADVLIVVAYGQILTQAVLEYPQYGCINVHGSLLPRWRGAAPIQRAILAGDIETGICIIQMDKGLDTGDVLARRVQILDQGLNSGDLIRAMPKLGIEALTEVLDQMTSNTLSPIPQSETGVCYAHKIEKKEANCHWQLSNDQVDRMIRAFNPDPVCFTNLGDLRVKIYTAAIHSDSNTGEPGEILNVSKKGVVVACGEGSVLLTRIQLPLGKGSILNGSDILNSRSDLVFAGAIFRSAKNINQRLKPCSAWFTKASVWMLASARRIHLYQNK